MPNETDKQKLSEQTLTKWLLEAGRSGADCGRVVTLVRELRATRKELALAKASTISRAVGIIDGNVDRRLAEQKKRITR